ncbi:phage/plasmid primase, P4 family [Trueperella sp. LYQ141]|uniref:phage/plasmid primase, P4 family n=1 Tax=Trueperella sp. LYQ141 TaxID=3391058 RepID=UPI003982F6B0
MNKQEQFSALPAFFRGYPQACCWKKQYRKNRLTKIPYQVRTGKCAKVNEPAHFVPMTEAIEKVDSFDGVRIRLSGSLVMMDIDHCREGDGWSLEAQEVLDHFSSTYAEVSPSGNGIHLYALVEEGFVLDTSAYYLHAGSFEIYMEGATNRFSTLSANVLHACEVTEQTQAVRWFLERFMRRPARQSSTVAIEKHSGLSDDEVLRKANACVQGERFRALWEGRWQELYPSQSKADEALCGTLAFFCGRDIEQMDRLFRHSALMRDKWDALRGEKTYGQRTLEIAIRNCTKVYQPDFGRVSAEEEFSDRLEKMRSLNPLKHYRLTDIGFAKLFMDVYEDCLCYVPERKSWYYFNGKVWTHDVGSVFAAKQCMDFVTLLFFLVKDIEEESRRSSFAKKVAALQKRSARVNLLKDAEVHRVRKMADFDALPHLFNCNNGTLNLLTETFSAHNPKDYLTKLADVDYDPAARAPRFERFIDEIMVLDQERIRFLQKICGYALTGDTRFECIIFYFGPTTRNGKGTLCETLLLVLGDYGMTARPELIMQKHFANSSSPSEEVARTRGARAIMISEIPKGEQLNASLVKTLSGGDSVNARFLHENSFDFRPQFKIFINTNYLPQVNDVTLFRSGRVLIVPFERHFTETEQDKTLKAQFRSETTKSAVLNWMLEGYRLLQKEGLKPPQTVIEATKSYEQESNKVLLFLEECLKAGSNFEVRTRDVYEQYRLWCEANGLYPESMRTFKQSLEGIATVVRKRPQAGGEKTTLLLGYRFPDDFLT